MSDPLFGPIPFSDGRELTLVELTYGRARILVGPVGAPWVDDSY